MRPSTWNERPAQSHGSYLQGWGLSIFLHMLIGVPSVGYYGGGITAMPPANPKGPVELHFGAKDAMIPLDGVKKFQQAHAEVPIFIYDADHGFNCDERPSYDKKAAEIALQRTLAFFAQPLRGYPRLTRGGESLSRPDLAASRSANSPRSLSCPTRRQQSRPAHPAVRRRSSRHRSPRER